MFLVPREVIPGAIWVYDYPISERTGSLCSRCNAWHWHIKERPPGWTVRDEFPAFNVPRNNPNFTEYSYINTPADARRAQ